MTMEINGNFFDYAGKQNYSSYAGMAGSGAAGDSAASGTKKKETEKMPATVRSSSAKNTAEYANELAKLVPSVEFQIGNSFSTAKSGKTLTVNPQLLEKMQNDPEKEKEMKELIRGVESAVSMLENVNSANGWTVVFKHCYIDENGKFCSIAYLRNDFMLNMSDELREKRRKNSEKLIEKTKEKAAEKKEELEETLEKKKEAEHAGEETVENAGEEAAKKAEAGLKPNKVWQLIQEKMAASKDGTVYLNDTDICTIIEAAQEDKAGKTTVKKQTQVGANLDLKI